MDFDGQGGRGVGERGKGNEAVVGGSSDWAKAEGGVGNESVRAEIGAKRQGSRTGSEKQPVAC